MSAHAASGQVTYLSVPLNTMLADLDETVRSLLRAELGRHGFDAVDVAFDAPDREWAASVTSPTVNLFLYDLREATELRPIDWEPRRVDGGRRELRPPLRLDVSFAVTAWTREVEDEHRLLSQVLAILYAYPELPEEHLLGKLRDGSLQRYPLIARVAHARQDGKADFWNAVGGQYKASIDYVVTLSVESGTQIERGPEVRTQTLRAGQRSGGVVEEAHRIGGTVRDAAGEPVADAWVVLLDRGAWARTNAEGLFRFEWTGPGRYRLRARGPGGGEAEAELDVPGDRADLVLGR